MIVIGGKLTFLFYITSQMTMLTTYSTHKHSHVSYGIYTFVNIVNLLFYI